MTKRPFRSNPSVGIPCLVLLAACAGAASFEPGAGPAGASSGDLQASGESGDAAPLLPADLAGSTWQQLGVATSSYLPDVIATPSGFMALSQRGIGDARAPSARESHLYRSQNGIDWEHVDISPDNSNLWLRGLAYGNGRYVLAGSRMGGQGSVVFTSSDGNAWTELQVDPNDTSGLHRAVYVGDRFFAMSNFRTLLSSVDGDVWSIDDLPDTVVVQDVAFGGGQYLVVGNGAPQWSSDARAWRATPLDCALPGACISDPSGNVLQAGKNRAVYAEGRFYVDGASTTDGATWDVTPGVLPMAYVDGYLLGSTADSELAFWRPGEATQHPLVRVSYRQALGPDAKLRWNGAMDRDDVTSENLPDDPMPATLSFPLPSGESCLSARCVVLGQQLYLVTDAER